MRQAADAIDTGALDRDAKRVVLRLQRHGYEAYFVGGCVRDLMIGRVPKDFDVATNATPQEIRRLFRNGRIIGRRFRLVHIHYGTHIIETATFRREPETKDDDEDLLITEDNVFGTASQDARRRDFTVNGLFFDPAKEEILDFVDGLDDLEDRVLRTIGDPDIRLAEDPVRILRAIKFATRLDLEIEEPTWEAMRAQSQVLERAAPPRVLEELLRLLRSGAALGAFRMLRACGALKVLMPHLDSYVRTSEDSDRFWRLLEALDNKVHQGFEPSTALSIAVLFEPLVERESDPDTRTMRGEPGDQDDVAWEVLEPMAIRTRLSRKEFGRARTLLANQPYFVESPGPRFSPLLFARSEDFEESLDLFGLRVDARGKGRDIYEGWVARQTRARSATEEDLEQERKRTRNRKRRKRRRRPGRGPKSGGGD